jgi:molecular chaperone DnaK
MSKESEFAKADALYVGIDLGTTNSLVAVVGPGGTPEILPARDNDRCTPSVVGLRVGSAEYLVGRQALNNAARDPRNTIRSIKRFIGLPYDDARVQVALHHVAYEVQRDPGREGALVVKLGDRVLTPEEVSAQVLQAIRADAEARLNRPVSHVVITVPAYFLPEQRAATRRAGALAGLLVRAIIDEPTAATIAERAGMASDEPARLLVFDFGGGTLDLAVVQCVGNTFTVIAHGGDNFLGGDDVDRAISDRIAEWIRAQGGEIQATNYRLQHDLKRRAEEAKRALSTGAPGAQIDIPGACRNTAGDIVDVERELSQDEFAKLLEPTLQRIDDVVSKLLVRESLQPEHFTEVLMVGGSSAIPAVQNLLRQRFDRDGSRRVRLSKNPMEAVALGAAMYARLVKGLQCIHCRHENEFDAQACSKCNNTLETATLIQDSAAGYTMTSRLPRSLGVSYRQGEDLDAYEVILPKGTPYPTREDHRKSFKIPSNDGFTIHIYEGDEPRASMNERISMVVVNQVPPDVRVGDPVEIQFDYSRDRTLLVSLSFPTSKTNFQPKYKTEAPSSNSSTEDQRAQLVKFLPRVRGFLITYAEFLDQGGYKKLKDDLGRAERAITAGDLNECARLEKVLSDSLFGGCGVASTLFLAENSIAEDDPQYGADIKRQAKQLRAEHKKGDAAHVGTGATLQRLLEGAFAKLYEKNHPADVRVQYRVIPMK